MSKDPYVILELDNLKNISKNDIKKSYKRLILKYHPDKNKDLDTTEKFKEIQTAYEILCNDEKKKEYDNLSMGEKINYYDKLKVTITNKYPFINDYLLFFIKNFYDDNEDNLQKDLENFNFSLIYKNIMDKIPDVLNNLPSLKLKENKPNKLYVIDINIKGKIKASLKDRYCNKYSNLLINRETKEPINIFVPLVKDEYILKNKGEVGINNINGDIIINIDIPKNYRNFTKIENDLYVELEIPLFKYLYGGEYVFKNLDDKDIKISCDNLLDNNIILLKEKGFITSIDQIDSESSVSETENLNINEQRGDMYIICKIKDYNLIKEKIKKNFSE